MRGLPGFHDVWRKVEGLLLLRDDLKFLCGEEKEAVALER